MAELAGTPQAEPHGPAPANADPDTVVNDDGSAIVQEATHAG